MSARIAAGVAVGSALTSGFSLNHTRKDFERRVARKERLGGQHFAEHDAKRPDVRPVVRCFARRLLRRHMRGRTQNDTGLRLPLWQGGGFRRCARRRPVANLRETKVQHLDCAVLAHFHVRGFQISMNNPLLVCGFERLGDAFCDRQGVGQRDRSARDLMAQIVPLDQFHHQRAPALEFFKTVKGGDGRMIQ